MAATPCDFHSLRSSLTCMARNFVLLAVLPAFLAVFAFAGLVEDVRESLSHQDFSSAQSALAAYKAKSGVPGGLLLDGASSIGRRAVPAGRKVCSADPGAGGALAQRPLGGFG